MRIALDMRLNAALDFSFQLTQATQELMVELVCMSKFVTLAREVAFNFGKFFGERGDNRLG